MSVSTQATMAAQPGPLQQAQGLLKSRYVPLAQAILPGMFLQQAGVFCNVARPGSDGKLHPAGVSRRYTAMTLIGLEAWHRFATSSQQSTGSKPVPPVDSAWQHMLDWALGDAGLGDAGLVLWGLCLKGDLDKAGQAASAILKRRQEALSKRAPFASMEMGWLGAGLGEAWAAGVGGSAVQELCLAVGRRLMENYHPVTGLFSFGRALRRRNIFAARVQARLGSFASQVYPVIALSRLATLSGRKEPLEAAGRCVETICRLQGSAGQWWWIYEVLTGKVVLKYPVYSVHQHAMGPMALLAYSSAAGTSRFDAALLAGLKWLDEHPELPEVALVEPARPVIWRAIQRHEYARTGTLGLSGPERLRMQFAAWTGRADERPFRGGHLCDECRPYCFGWLLLAAAWAGAGGAPKG